MLGRKVKLLLSVLCVIAVGTVMGCSSPQGTAGEGSERREEPVSGTEAAPDTEEITRGTEEAAVDPGADFASVDVPDLGQLKGLTVGDKPSIDLEKDYYPYVDEITKELFGFTVRWDFVSWGETSSTYNTKIASGEYDLITVGAWGNYTTYAQSNAFYDLSQVIEETPGLIELFGEDTLQNIRINNKLNSIPCVGTTSPNLFIYRADQLEAWGLEPVTDFETMFEYMVKAQEEAGIPICYDKRLANFFVKTMIPVVTEFSPMNYGDFAVVVSDQGNPFEPYLLYENEAFVDAVTLAKRWYDAGIIDPDVLNQQFQRQIDLFKEGATSALVVNHVDNFRAAIEQTAVLNMNGGNDPDGENPQGVVLDYFLYWPEDADLYSPNLADSSGIALSSGISDEAASAVIKFIEKIHTDQEFFDLFQYGVEGISYNSFPEDGVVDFGDIVEEQRTYRKFGLGFTNDYMARTEAAKYPEIDEPFKQLREELNERIQDNPYSGFVFDTEIVEIEISACNQVLAERAGLFCGITDDPQASVTELVDSLYNAGMDVILEEVQRQVNEFREIVER